MNKQMESSKNFRTIEVKGMNGLSINYIQRFFGHAGPVEEVKKVQDLVIVKFKSQSSINKAMRFNGRVIDKQPIKIRTAISCDMQQPITQQAYSKKEEVNKAEKLLNQVIKNKQFDVPFFWASALKIISKVTDKKLRWIIHEIFFIKLSQVIHLHAFQTNIRSNYFEIILKQIFLGQNGGNMKMSQDHEKIEKLEIFPIPANDLSDEANFEAILLPLNLRLKYKFKDIFKAIEGERLYLLYSLFHNFSIHIPKGESIFSQENNLSLQNRGQFFSVSKEIVTKNRARISLRENNSGVKRSEYRKIDNQHPNKQIEILSDCSTQNLLQHITYDIFRDDFDGTITNNCASDIFFEFKFHFASNKIIIRYYESGKYYSIRLDFELRLLNCEDEKMDVLNFCIYFHINEENSFEQVPEIKFMKHNVVLADYENIEKVLYLLQNYSRFCLDTNISKMEDIETSQKLGIFFIQSNPTQEKQQIIKVTCQQISKNQFLKDVANIYLIHILDNQKFEKVKVSNFIEEYVDQQKGSTFNMEIAKAHAKLLVEERPQKFQLISQPEEFVAQEIWRLEQLKSKRAAKNRIKTHLYNVRFEGMPT